MNKNMILGVSAATGAVTIAAVAAFLTTPQPLSEGYTAISTVNNQFFVGRAYHAPLSRYIELREPFLLQAVAGENGNTATPQLVDLSVESYWLPQAIDFHIDTIVSKGAVGEDSAIAVKIREYKAGGAQ